MKNISFLSSRINWPKLAVGLIIAGVVALSVHTVMLQLLGVPFPDLSIIPKPFKFVNRVFVMLGLLFLCQFASPNIRRSSLKLWSLLFLMVAMLTESLIRGPFMQGYCTDAWVFAFVGSLGGLLTIAWSCLVAVVVYPKLPQVWHKVAAAIVIVAFNIFAVSPALSIVMGHIMEISHLAPQGEWCELPYGLNVLIPAYLTFVEPVLGCLAAVILTWRQLPLLRMHRFAIFTLIILALKNQLLTPFVYAIYAKESFLTALASDGQFALEVLALALLVGFAWEWATKSDSIR